MLEGSQVVVCVIAHLMALFQYLLEQLRVAPYVVADEEEGCLDVKLAQRFQQKRRTLRNGSVVERQVYCMLVGIHSPEGSRIEPSQPSCRLLYKHRITVNLKP